MPDFLLPNRWPTAGIYPDQAQRLIEQLRRFVTNDRLAQKSTQYHAAAKAAGGVLVARMRERQPLIEAFESYDRATRRGQRRLRSLQGELAGLANVAAHYHIVAPTLSGSLAQHQAGKLIDLNGQLQPLLLEWKTASHIARTTNAEISWYGVDKTGPEFVARACGIEWEVECKYQSHMITELLGVSEADELADRIIRQISKAGLQGSVSLSVPSNFDAHLLTKCDALRADLEMLATPGHHAINLLGSMQLDADLSPTSGTAVPVQAWRESLEAIKHPDARLYAFSRAVGGRAADPITLQMHSARRSSSDLLEYLWERKFQHAAEQCSGERAAVLSFEWEGVDDPHVFSDSEGMQALLARTFDEHRHVAAIAMRCTTAPTSLQNAVDFSVGAYLAKSSVTTFPQVLDLIALDSAGVRAAAI